MGRFENLVNDAVRVLSQHAISRSSTSTLTSTLPERDASLLRLNANESVYGPSPKAVAAMRAAMESSHLYPDDRASALRDRLAQLHAIQPEQILVANGLTALLGVIARTCLRPGLNALTSACSFISYPMVTGAVGARLVQTPLKEGGYDPDAMLAAIDTDTRVAFVANPNNPTGTLLDASAMDRFLDRVPAHVLSCSMKLISITPLTSRLNAASPTRIRWNMFALNETWSCCEPSPRRTASLVSASATAWGLRS